MANLVPEPHNADLKQFLANYSQLTQLNETCTIQSLFARSRHGALLMKLIKGAWQGRGGKW